MQIQTFSVVVGGTSCNARCPFCVARLTGSMDIAKKIDPDANHWRRFRVACELAKRAGATTAMLTGKGEPTLWPDLVGQYIRRLYGEFPLIELQTNGLLVHKLKSELAEWAEHGLTTVGVSVAHWDAAKNAEVYTGGKRYPDLSETIATLHGVGLSVRLFTVMAKGYIDNPSAVLEMIQFAKRNKVEQLTLMPVAAPEVAQDPAALGWVAKHSLTVADVECLKEWLERGGHAILDLPNGARVYDFLGQNVCLSNCLKRESNDLSNLRNLIFFPDGHLRHRWDYEGAIIL